MITIFWSRFSSRLDFCMTIFLLNLVKYFITQYSSSVLFYLAPNIFLLFEGISRRPINMQGGLWVIILSRVSGIVDETLCNRYITSCSITNSSSSAIDSLTHRRGRTIDNVAD